MAKATTKLGKIARTTNEILMDRSIRHAIFLERLKRKEAQAIVNFISRKLIPDLRKQISNLEGIAARGQNINFKNVRRLTFILKQLDKAVDAAIQAAERRTAKSLAAIAKAEAEWQLSVLRASIPIGLELEFVAPAPALLRGIVAAKPFRGRLLSEWYRDLGEATKRQARSIINIGMAEGQTVSAMQRGMRRVTGTTQRNAAVVVRTAIQSVTAGANELVYGENEDTIKGIQYIATLDTRTTEICAVLDGQIFKVNQGPRPPQHLQCRSRTAPVLKSWKELGIDLKEAPPGTRASMNGQVPRSLTYPKWLKTQPISVQNEALGIGKAKLFRSGKVPITRFLDEGRPLSLAQVLEREGLSSP